MASLSKSLVLLPLLLIAACTPDAPADKAVATGTYAGEAASSTRVATDCPQSVYSATPPGMSVDHDYLVRTDRVYTTKDGAERRRTTLELLDTAPEPLAKELMAALLANGYREIQQDDQGDGIQRFAARKPGLGRINISASNDVGKRPSHPRSVGLLAFDWPLAPETDGNVDDEDGASELPEQAGD